MFQVVIHIGQIGVGLLGNRLHGYIRPQHICQEQSPMTPVAGLLIILMMGQILEELEIGLAAVH